MSNETYVPIETPVGILHHRDAIFLASLDLDYEERTLVLEGICSGHTDRYVSEDTVSYTLRFVGVMALRMVELDSWFHGYAVSVPMQSSLWEVKDSEWQTRLGGKITPEHRHFTVLTYDDVIDVICNNMEFVVHPSNFCSQFTEGRARLF